MAETLYTFDTEYSADCCEYNENIQILATGTYQVNKLDPESESPETERLGRIYLHKINLDGDTLKCDVIAREESPAVLDMKWNMKEQILGSVNAGGELVIYNYSCDKENIEISNKNNISEGLALALEWNCDNEKIIVSDSKGKIHVINFTESNTVALAEFAGHGYEAWTCCFSATDQNIVFSGGDDCSLNCYDLRTEGVVMKNSKVHSMGVTSMISDRTKDHQLITGSYDENIRWWDERSLKRELESLNVGGGVWRIKQRKEKLLIGAMHGGFLVVEGGNVVARYNEHESLAYGADWLSDSTAATCSFYDHNLRIWTL